MSVDELQMAAEPATDDYMQYRALSSLAVVGLVLGLLSVLALLAWMWLAVPVAGVLLSLAAIRQIKKRSDELTGLPAAQTGLILSAIFLVIGPARLIAEHITELPDGYTRISYSDLQPDPSHPGELIPQAAKDLDGKRVFIKGYVYPGRETENIRTFLLVRDQGDCCFGGDPKITDRIQVTLVDPLRLTYRPRLHKLAGVFRILPAKAIGAGGGVYYQLEADHLK